MTLDRFSGDPRIVLTPDGADLDYGGRVIHSLQPAQEILANSLASGLAGYWSCDSMPDIPDNAAGTLYLWNAGSTLDSWSGTAGTTASIESGAIKGVFDGSNSNGAAINHAFITGVATGKTVRLRVRSLNAITSVDFYFGGSVQSITTPTSRISAYEWIVDLALTYTSGGEYLYVNKGSSATNTAWWSWIYFGDGSYSTLLIDDSGNGNNATVYGATPVAGVSGKALSFDGTNDKILSVANPSPVTAITMAAWINTPSLGSGQNQAGIITYGYSPKMFLDGSGKLSSGASLTYTAGISLFDNVWHHVVFTHDGTTASLYIDGLFKISASYALVVNLTTKINIGDDPNGAGRFFYGTIDEPRIYSRALSAAEVAYLYANPKPANGVTTIQGSGQPVMDQGLENEALISLFTAPGWIGNLVLPAANRIGSAFEGSILGQGLTLSGLANIQNMAALALASPDFPALKVVATNPASDRVKLVVTLGPGLQPLNFLRAGQNWQAQAQNPASSRLVATS